MKIESSQIDESPFFSDYLDIEGISDGFNMHVISGDNNDFLDDNIFFYNQFLSH